MLTQITKSQLYYFSLIFIPLTTLFFAVSLIYFYSVNNANLEALKQSEFYRLFIQNQAFEKEIDNIVDDLVILTSHQEFNAFLNEQEHDYSLLEQEYLVFAKQKTMCDQVRLLDKSGHEKIRINYKKSSHDLVEKEALQFKGERYYFKDTIGLNAGEIFISAFDLNVEKGKIEVPLKPTIRFGMPVINGAGEKIGVLILNYLGQSLIDSIEKSTFQKNHFSKMLITNAEGFFYSWA